MSTNVSDLSFDESAGTLRVIKRTYEGGIFIYAAPTNFEFQENGVMFDHVDSGDNYRIFLPYSVIDEIDQVV